ncbi:ribonuclease R [Parvularcula maris]|uniref:Ribonuclease R n=1 Tax=Parvularcula maris TaxID=2965077 RepID=A0A9X2L7D7_9PROT|nr:ribonuclease R [Parvularcula maris]MCQ8184299.1 ribonuclease R [Parvularcula maris]
MPIPSDQELIDFIESETKSSGDSPAQRDIAKAFGIKGADRAELRRALRRLEDEGKLRLEGKRARRPGQLPPVTVMTAQRMDGEGDLVCSLAQEEIEAEVLLPSKEAAKARPPIGVGDRFLGRIHQDGESLRASVIKVLPKPEGRILGTFTASKRSGGFVDPVSRRTKTSYEIGPKDTLGAKEGDLVFAEPVNQRGYGPKRGRVTEVVGSVTEERNLSLIALAEHDIPLEFPSDVMREAEAIGFQPSKHHVDLTGLPLVTIDPATARDHDDAVHAERLEDGGFRLTVAIADVSYFVRPGSAIDREAEKRGNSVYLPDRVVPMLPERLSNDLCSLKEGQERLALACEIEIGAKGGKRKHRFFRAKIKNHQNLAYERAQAIEDGEAEGLPVVGVLFEAYRALIAARERRQPLDLDMAERRIIMGEDGTVEGVERKERMDAHRLIEEFMVLANVCAAETLEEHRRTAIYRVHEPPDPERLAALREYLTGLGYSLPKADDIRSKNLNGVLKMARQRDEIDIIALSILRSQSQAVYDTENVGHFGLSLKRYAHFTSPIRRYADLTVHRGLVRALGLGEGAEREEDEERLDGIAEDISKTERAAVQAERDTQARMLAAFLEEQVGATFTGRISGVTRVGLFVTLDETGADGFVPMRTLGWEYFEHDEKRSRVVGQESGGTFSLGMPVKVRLVEVTPLQGGLRFDMLSKPALPSKKEKPKEEEKRPSRHEKAKGEARRARNKKRKEAAPKKAPAAEKAKLAGKRPASKKKEPAADAPKAFARRPKKKR